MVEKPLTLLSDVEGVNASAHANGNVEFKFGSQNSLVEGFGTYAGNLVRETGQSVLSLFQPPSNPDGTARARRTGERSVPNFKAGEHQHRATQSTGARTLSGTVTLGTKANPVVWYVDGDLSTSGPVVFEGYGVFIVRGNATFGHDTTMGEGVESSVGIYAEGNIEVQSGRTDVVGQLWSGGNTRFASDVTLTGGATVGGNLELLGPTTIRYRPASNAITEPLWPGQSSTVVGSGGNGLTLLRVSEGG